MKFALCLIVVVIGQFSRGELKSPFDLVTPVGTSLTPPENLTASQVEQDRELLIEVFEKAFSGKFYFSNKKIQEVVHRLRTIQGEMTPSDLWIKIDQALLEIPDKHLSATLFLSGQSQMTPLRLQKMRWPQVGKNRISNPSKIWEVSKVGKNHDVALISITRFPSDESVWKAFLQSVREAIQNSKATILDLRSNSGGNDFYGMEMAKIFWGGPFHHVIEKQFNNTSPEALAIFANHFRLEAIKTGQDQNPASNPEQYANSYLQLMKKALNGLIPPIQTRPKEGSDAKAVVTASGYHKPIFILIDALTASSGEFTALALSLHPNAMLVGENSGGFVHFGNAGILLLPNSKVEVAISTQFSRLENNLFVEETGVAPGWVIPAGADAFDAVMSKVDQQQP